jgi:outer membrane murein-binding lipoprotein Lpp
MSPFTGHRGTAAAVAGAVMVSSLLLAGCGVVNEVNKISHTVASNKSTIDAFTAKLQSGEAAAFEAKYVTTGSTPATIVYAVQPPKGLLFKDSSANGGNGLPGTQIVVNGSGEYACSPPGSGHARWTCQKLGKASATVQNQIFGLYTPSHWVAFLKTFALAAGFAGDKVSTSAMTVNGFSMSCVDFRASGIPGTSTICTTAQGILGYVKVAGDSTSFQIKSYTTSPRASLFRLPPGAKVTRLKAGRN